MGRRVASSDHAAPIRILSELFQRACNSTVAMVTDAELRLG